MVYTSYRYVLGLLLILGQVLFAQESHSKQAEFYAKSYYRIPFPQLSEDGQWSMVYQTFGNGKNDLIIQGKNRTFTRYNVFKGHFLADEKVLIQSGDQLELLDVIKEKSVFFKGLERFEILGDSRHILIHYKDKSLELRDSNGQVLHVLHQTFGYTISQSGTIYAIEKRDSLSSIFSVDINHMEQRYTTLADVKHIKIDGNEGVLITQTSKDKGTNELVYLDLQEGNTYLLSQLLKDPYDFIFSERLEQENTFFVETQQFDGSSDNLVDIWYGMDYKLDEKFRSNPISKKYVWYPKKKHIDEIELLQSNELLNIGSDRFFVRFDPYRLSAYANEKPPLSIVVMDREKDREIIMEPTVPELVLSYDRGYGLVRDKKEWALYDFTSGSSEVIHGKALDKPYFSMDGAYIIFEGFEGLWKYDIKKHDLSRLVTSESTQVHLANGVWEGIRSRHGLFGISYVKEGDPLLLRLENKSLFTNAYVLLDEHSTKQVMAPTPNKVHSLQHNSDYTIFSYVEENTTISPRFMKIELGKDPRILFQSNIHDEGSKQMLRETIQYSNSLGESLQGILYYPINYTKGMKYPMVVHVYAKQHHKANQYLLPTYYEGDGFNIRLLLEKGYFVYLPDIATPGRMGPGSTALDCVDQALDAIAGNVLIDMNNIGLIGHSFGGYEADYIATQSKRFKAYVSGSGHSDIIWAYHAFNYNFLFPDYIRIMNNQYQMNKAFTESKEKYVKNNPLYFVDAVSSPVLLWTGLNDQNVTSDHTMAFYNGLSKNKKDVVALFYKDEGHSIQNSKAQLDLTSKVLDWFDFHLKDKNEIEWIKRGLIDGKLE